MRVSARQLRRFCPTLPPEPRELKWLFDDLGLEVKRLEVVDDDILLSLELLANRGDHYCYHGLARELSARLKAPLSLPPIAEVRFATAGSVQGITVETDLCPFYTLTPFEAAVSRGFPAGSSEREILAAAAVESGNAIVDATNLVNLELGHPTHAFDRECVVGGITIRQSRPGERAWLLFTPGPQELPAGTLIVADDEKVLAIAGVIGCEDSRITEATHAILVESAVFDPTCVRRAARALRVQTAASIRFERGCDASAVVPAIGRLAAVLEGSLLGRRADSTRAVGEWRDPNRIIRLDLRACQQFFERAWSDAEVVELLAPYGFQHQGDLAFLVPPHRLWDVENQEDLFEELGRSIGWNALPERLPSVSVGSLPSRGEETMESVDSLLIANGFEEIYTDSFYARQMRTDLGITEGHALWEHVSTLNSVDKGHSLLKNNCLAQALDSVAANLRFRTNHFRIYEWARTYHPDRSAENGVCRERRMLWGAAVGLERVHQWDGASRQADLYFVKGVLEEVRAVLGLALDFTAPDAGHPLFELMHPYRSVCIALDGRAVGIAGEVHPHLLRAFEIKNQRPVYFELEVEALLQPRVSRPFVSPPEVPDIERMLSFAAPVEIAATDLEAEMVRGAPQWLKRVEVADVFRSPDGERSATFRLSFDAVTPRTTDELNAACQSVTLAVTEAFGARGVRLR